jgi:hypothetical protein
MDNTPQKIQLLGCSARRFPEQYSSIARTSNAAIVPLCFWILNTPQKIQLLGCSARRPKNKIGSNTQVLRGQATPQLSPLFLDTQYASENSTLGMQCKTLPTAILKYGEDKRRRNRPPLFLDTQYALENSTLGMQCKTLPGAILKYCEDKQRRNAPKC